MVRVREDEKYYCDFEGDAPETRVEVKNLLKSRGNAEIEILEDCEVSDLTEGETVWVEEDALYRM